MGMPNLTKKLRVRWWARACIGDRFNLEKDGRIYTGVVAGFTPMVTLRKDAQPHGETGETRYPIVVCDNGGFPGRWSDTFWGGLHPERAKKLATWTSFVVTPKMYEDNKALNLHLEGRE